MCVCICVLPSKIRVKRWLQYFASWLSAAKCKGKTQFYYTMFTQLFTFSICTVPTNLQNPVCKSPDHFPSLFGKGSANDFCSASNGRDGFYFSIVVVNMVNMKQIQTIIIVVMKQIQTHSCHTYDIIILLTVCAGKTTGGFIKGTCTHSV